MKTVHQTIRRGIAAMIGADDAHLYDDTQIGILRASIKAMYLNTVKNGGTSLSFEQWKDAIRSGKECDGSSVLPSNN